ncbi:DUF6920 family protein [Spongiibacter marinus]|uniref:DUF6920 family protein n=1 Tax=Spongiibacter marinus TaxID=354246 RepID=UPI003BF55662
MRLWQQGKRARLSQYSAIAANAVSMHFHFNSEGEVTRVSTPERFCWVNDGYEKRPWEGRFYHYQRRSGMWLPNYFCQCRLACPSGGGEVWRGIPKAEF